MPIATVYEASQRDRNSINLGVSGVARTSGGSGVSGVFRDNVPWTVAERDGDAGSVRFALSAYSAASVRITALQPNQFPDHSTIDVLVRLDTGPMLVALRVTSNNE